MRTVASLADFSALQVKSFAMAISVNRTNNEKTTRLIFAIDVTLRYSWKTRSVDWNAASYRNDLLGNTATSYEMARPQKCFGNTTQDCYVVQFNLTKQY